MRDVNIFLGLCKYFMHNKKRHMSVYILCACVTHNFVDCALGGDNFVDDFPNYTQTFPKRPHESATLTSLRLILMFVR